jgi:hypothetical protein
VERETILPDCSSVLRDVQDVLSPENVALTRELLDAVGEGEVLTTVAEQLNMLVAERCPGGEPLFYDEEIVGDVIKRGQDRCRPLFNMVPARDVVAFYLRAARAVPVEQSETLIAWVRERDWLYRLSLHTNAWQVAFGDKIPADEIESPDEIERPGRRVPEPEWSAKVDPASRALFELSLYLAVAFELVTPVVETKQLSSTVTIYRLSDARTLAEEILRWTMPIRDRGGRVVCLVHHDNDDRSWYIIDKAKKVAMRDVMCVREALIDALHSPAKRQRDSRDLVFILSQAAGLGYGKIGRLWRELGLSSADGESDNIDEYMKRQVARTASKTRDHSRSHTDS